MWPFSCATPRRQRQDQRQPFSCATQIIIYPDQNACAYKLTLIPIRKITMLDDKNAHWKAYSQEFPSPINKPVQRSRAKNEIRSLWQRDFIWSTAFWFASYSGKECLQILTTFFFPFSKRHHRRKYIQETIKWNFLILLWWLLCTYYQLLYCPIIFLRNHLCQGGTVRDRNLTHVPKKREEFIFSVILIVTKKTI